MFVSEADGLPELVRVDGGGAGELVDGGAAGGAEGGHLLRGSECDGGGTGSVAGSHVDVERAGAALHQGFSRLFPFVPDLLDGEELNEVFDEYSREVHERWTVSKAGGIGTRMGPFELKHSATLPQTREIFLLVNLLTDSKVPSDRETHDIKTTNRRR